MKKMTFLTLTVFLGMLIFVSNIFAQSNTTVRISFTAVQSLAVGELLTLPLTITSGENVAGYRATVSYDTSVLRYVSSKNGDYLPAGAFFVPPIVAGNTVTLAATSLAGESNGDGTLATLNFTVLWDTRSWEHLYTLDDHEDGVNSVMFSSESSTLATGLQNGTIQLWKPRSGELLHTLKGTDSVNSVAFSPDDKMLASGYDDKNIRLWDVLTGRRL